MLFLIMIQNQKVEILQVLQLLLIEVFKHHYRNDKTHLSLKF